MIPGPGADLQNQSLWQGAGNLEASIPAVCPGGTLRKHLWKEVYNLLRTLLSKCDFYSEAGVLSK